MSGTGNTNLFVKLINRRNLNAEKFETGKITFCTDTTDTFFDQNTRSRVCLGRVNNVEFESDLKYPNIDDIGSFIIIKQEGKVKYTTSELKRIDVTTRDQMVELLGGWDVFIPYNLTSDGKLIAPRTLASCVFTGDGVSIDELMEGVQEFIDEFTLVGIDASRITSGTIDYERLPKEARLDFYPVENQDARLALTKEQIQNNDVVQENDTGKMFFVIDDTKLGTEAAFKEFTVGSIPWNAVVNRPLSISLKNGAVGTLLTVTSSTTESQKLSMNVELNVDYVSAGILSKMHGGTGNQTGTAAYVENDKNDELMNIAGFGSNGKMKQANTITAENGIIKASGYTTNNREVYSNLPKLNSNIINLKKNDTIVNSINAVNDTSSTNIVKYENGVVFGDINDLVSILADILTLNAGKQVTVKIGINDILNITDQNVESKKPISARTKVVITGSDGAEGGAITRGNMGVCVSYSPNNKDTNNLYPNMVASTYTSAVDGTILSSANNTFGLKRTKGSGPLPNADNIVEIHNDSAKINGDMDIGHDLSVYNDLKVKGHIYGTVSKANDSTKLGGRDSSEYMLKDGSNMVNSPVIIQANEPAGRTNCLWINSTTGVANYWTGAIWTPISNTWKS